jgi:carbon monoxide dehydrogenase subunit G
MQLKQRFVVNHPRAAVWDFFGKMDEVVPCMPGASLTEPLTGNLAKFQFNVKLGPISATFVGDAHLERDAANFRGVIRGNARDNRGDSRVKSVVEYVLTEEPDGARTAVDISVDFTLTGRLAQFSRAGIVNDLAARLTADFAQNLEVALAPQTAEDSNQPSTAEAAPTPAPKASSSEIHAGRLLVSIIWSRIKALFRSIFGR